MSSSKGKIIVAPLNWGWGHATRCIPIIQFLKAKGFEPIIASDGDALALLQKEFPELSSFTLPSYGIRYKKQFKLGVLINLPTIIRAIKLENKVLKDYVSKHDVLGLIADNRPGLFHKTIKTVYITHQLNIKFGTLSKMINKTHHQFIKKYDYCWVPDGIGNELSGELSETSQLPFDYIGALSRLERRKVAIKYDVLILLSGIEAQRHRLEQILVKAFANYKGKVLFVRGTLQVKTKLNLPENIKVIDYLLAKDLSEAIQESEIVISRSGYTTIMDLAKLIKKAILIPTPGQTEQEYLAEYLAKKNKIKTCHENDFSLDLLSFDKDCVLSKFTNEDLLSKAMVKVFGD